MKQFRISLLILLIFSFLTGVVYPLMITGIARLAVWKKASGSFVTVRGRVVGSELIGQNFTGARYFHGRPSANKCWRRWLPLAAGWRRTMILHWCASRPGDEA